MVFCDNCGHKLRTTAKFCASCGTAREPTDDTPKSRSRERPARPRKKSREEELAEYEEEYLSRSKNTKSKSKTKSRQDSNEDTARHRRSMERPMGWKSESTTLLLSIILGFLCISGAGHLYLGVIGRGVGILIGGLVLVILGFATIMIGVGIVFLCVVFFGISTIFTYSYYGSVCARFLFGVKGQKIYLYIFISTIVFFASISLDSAINMAGLSNQGYSAKCFRPTGATYAIQLGYDPEIIMRVGRWKTRSVFFEHYVHSQVPSDYTSALLQHT